MNVGQRVDRLAPGLAGVLAPNPGPMTLSGTNTWVLGRPGRGPVLVVDPGPEDEEHLRRVLDVAGGRVAAVLRDPPAPRPRGGRGRGSPGSRAAASARSTRPGGSATDGLADGDVLEVAGARVEVLATPGHTDDSVSLLLTHGTDDGRTRSSC